MIVIVIFVTDSCKCITQLYTCIITHTINIITNSCVYCMDIIIIKHVMYNYNTHEC